MSKSQNKETRSRELIEKFFEDNLSKDEQEEFMKKAARDNDFLSDWVDQLKEETEKDPRVKKSIQKYLKK